MDGQWSLSSPSLVWPVLKALSSILLPRSVFHYLGGSSNGGLSTTTAAASFLSGRSRSSLSPVLPWWVSQQGLDFCRRTMDGWSFLIGEAGPWMDPLNLSTSCNCGRLLKSNQVPASILIDCEYRGWLLQFLKRFHCSCFQLLQEGVGYQDWIRIPNQWSLIHIRYAALGKNSLHQYRMLIQNVQ
jgi:hypothetical protein